MPHGLSFITTPKCKKAENLLLYEIISFKPAEEILIHTPGPWGVSSSQVPLCLMNSSVFISCHFTLHVARLQPMVLIPVCAFIQTGNNNKKKPYLQWWQLYVPIAIQHHGVATARARRTRQREEKVPCNKRQSSSGSHKVCTAVVPLPLPAVFNCRKKKTIYGEQKPCKYWGECASETTDGKSGGSRSVCSKPRPSRAAEPRQSSCWKQRTYRTTNTSKQSQKINTPASKV